MPPLTVVTSPSPRPRLVCRHLVVSAAHLADALDLDDAIRSIAGDLADLGCEEPLAVRRSLAAGELARRRRPRPGQHRAQRGRRRGRGFRGSLARTSTTGTTRRPVRRVVLHVHLAHAAITGTDHAEQVGRVENTRSPVTAGRRSGVVRPPRHPPDDQARDRPRRPHRRRRLRDPRPDQARPSRCATTPVSSRGAPDPPAPCNPTGIPATATTSRRTSEKPQTCSCSLAPLCDATTGSRPTPPGDTPPSTPAPTSVDPPRLPVPPRPPRHPRRQPRPRLTRRPPRD